VIGSGSGVAWRDEDPGGLRPYTVRAEVGRVVEVRLRRLRHIDDVRSIGALVRAAACRAGPSALIFSDMRRMAPVPHRLADLWSRDMRGLNADIVRSGVLLDPDNITFNLQLERVVQCAGSPMRRLFFDASELREWLASAATAAERAHLDALLA
jgi:hypothetical protein